MCLWQLCGKTKLEWAEQWYKHTLEQVVENRGFKVLWNFSVQCDRMVEARKLDIIWIIDIAILEITSKTQRTGEK